jgi:hypothetical protein
MTKLSQDALHDVEGRFPATLMLNLGLRVNVLLWMFLDQLTCNDHV